MFKEGFRNERRDRIRDQDIMERYGNGSSLLERMNQSILKKFGHMESMDERRLAKLAWKWLELGGGTEIK